MSATPQEGDARCPRCGNAFHCGMHDPAPCACSGITLDAATLAQLRQRHDGCLCLNCLRALAPAESKAGAP